ncbi:MAG: WecB/TagA/CpsF family glycosyltransferase [Peptococcaceae bacterium]|nr:WecB/TagA/CpsF family glycosyltransferase [Peptococcaceae bacterium]
MRLDVLGAPVDRLELDQFVEAISQKLKEDKACFVVTLNPEMLCCAQGQCDLMDIIKSADLVTPDGVGIVWACKMAGQPVSERVTGIDLMMKLLEHSGASGWRVFFLGSAPGVPEAAAKRAEAMFPGINIVGTQHGYFTEQENQDVLTKIAQASPDLVFVALGSPRQERWIDQNREQLGKVMLMGVGGSLDVLSGVVQRSPRWFNERNLEWLGRLLCQPSRWKRMLVLPKFVVMVYLKHRFRLCKKSKGKV